MTTPSPNRAIWIDENNQLSLRTISEPYTPQDAQVLVQVLFSGINPADIKHGLHLGLNNYPSGYEYSGRVTSVGPNCSTYHVGDLVAGHNLVGKHKPIYHGAHQDTVVGEHFLFHVPAHMPAPDAACISIMAQTAADALFNQLGLSTAQLLRDPAAPPPAEQIPTPLSTTPTNTAPLLIWGGASNVGLAAIQLAKAAGIHPILTTASPTNHALLRGLGADACFDYRAADVVTQIRSAVAAHAGGGRVPLMHVLDAVGVATDACEACCDAAADAAVLAATLPVPRRPRWRMVLATRNVDFPAPRPDGTVHWVRGNAQWQATIDAVFAWSVQHYGTGFRVPRVRVVKGAEEGMEAMRHVALGKSSLEKVVIEHPL